MFRSIIHWHFICQMVLPAQIWSIFVTIVIRDNLVMSVGVSGVGNGFHVPIYRLWDMLSGGWGTYALVVRAGYPPLSLQGRPSLKK